MTWHNVLIAGDPDRPLIASTAESIIDMLSGWEGMHVEYRECQPDEADLHEFENGLIVVVGGDGSILGAARSLQGRDTPVLGINLGKLGFMAAIEIHDALNFIGDVLCEEDYVISKRHMLKIRMGGKEYHALNEAVVRTRDPVTINVRLSINKKSATYYRGDGLIVSTLPVAQPMH